MDNFNQAIHSDLCTFMQPCFELYHDNVMLSCLGKALSYGEVDSLSNQFSNFLVNHIGLQPGDRLAIQLPNSLQYGIAVYGALKAGVIIVNCNPMYTPREMAHQFNDAGAKALLIFKPMLTKYEAISTQVEIESVIVTDMLDIHHRPNNSLQDEKGYFDLCAALSSQENRLISVPRLHDDLVLLQYTGGTTGVSKGAMLSHQNILANTIQTMQQASEMFREAQELMVQPLPLYHITAFVSTFFMQASRGNSILLIPNPSDIDAFVDQLAGQPFTLFCGINTLFVGLCRHPDFKALDFSALNTTISGGAALTQAAIEAWENTTGCSIAEGYGLSETSPVIAINDPLAIDYGSVGREVYATIVKLIDENGNEVNDGETGELTMQGPQLMQGYWNRPDATNEVMTSDGFFRTGDVAYRNIHGNICIVDRLKDMILVSGFNVYPNEIEMVLTSHEKVFEAAVIGQPDEKTGERIEAYITALASLDENEILDYCRQNLVAYKIPKVVHIVDELPKSSVGKILRRKLR